MRARNRTSWWRSGPRWLCSRHGSGGSWTSCFRMPNRQAARDRGTTEMADKAHRAGAIENSVPGRRSIRLGPLPGPGTIVQSNVRKTEFQFAGGSHSLILFDSGHRIRIDSDRRRAASRSALTGQIAELPKISGGPVFRRRIGPGLAEESRAERLCAGSGHPRDRPIGVVTPRRPLPTVPERRDDERVWRGPNLGWKAAPRSPVSPPPSPHVRSESS